MRYPEIAELTLGDTVSRTAICFGKAFEWMADDREYFQLCGFMLMARLLDERQSTEMNVRAGISLIGIDKLW